MGNVDENMKSDGILMKRNKHLERKQKKKKENGK